MLNSCNAIWWRCLFFVSLDDVFIFSHHWLYFVSFYFLFCNILPFASFPTFLFLPRPSISNLSLSIPVFPFQSLPSPFRAYLPLSFFSFLLLFPGLFIAKLWIWIRWICEILDTDPRIRIQGENINQKLHKTNLYYLNCLRKKRDYKKFMIFIWQSCFVKKISKS